MPAMFSPGQHPVLTEVGGKLADSEAIFASLDDVYVVCKPDRVVEIFGQPREALRRHARIEEHMGKTKVWNRGWGETTAVRQVQAAASGS